MSGRHLICPLLEKCDGGYPRVSSDTPSPEAFIFVAAIVRFNVRAILSAPNFFLASPFSLRISVAVNSRRNAVFFLAIFDSTIYGNGLVATRSEFASVVAVFQIESINRPFSSMARTRLSG